MPEEPAAEEAAIEPADTQPAEPQPSSTLAELERLADLRDRGVLSEEEFEALKAEILSGS